MTPAVAGEQVEGYTVLTEHDLSGLRAQAEQMSNRFHQLSGNLSELRQELARIRGRATSPDGYVTAEVGPRGELLDLKLDGRIYRKPDAAALARTISQTVSDAARDAAERAQAVNTRYAPDVDVTGMMRGESDLNARLQSIRDRLMNGAPE
ncbi:YbaB/EbfC family nucleoid-associated protein [Kineosporia sp. J2-2]|uniref:YbaB/EbfC family nucleoid-associated protein n=1 Tax=Kineosporia corallincola TaxID=2835133 RepID=A0ABS5TAN3_9ACTN|nr:YbaB/EbfC family nucleoid-associated protein [Kineosporia corallincola]MBT0768122.1 YbaB/EbfC family nucleoid-associated protein [Kineosporia corallincola]